MNASIYWLIAFLILLVIEIFTLGLTTIWFAIGAIAAFIAALINLGPMTQIGIFLFISGIMLLVTRPLAVKYLGKNTIKTNVDEIIGETALITKTIVDANNLGEAKLNGEIWIAKSENGQSIEEGTVVEIVAVNGVKLIVKESI